MALNRETKRLLKKQGEIDDDGQPMRTRQAPRKAPPPQREHVSAKQFGREVRGELRKVAWPTREETINFSIVVLSTLVVLTAIIFTLDWIFARAVLDLFNF